ncbi:putative diguanylate cyclase YcdT [compost metagenome]
MLLLKILLPLLILLLIVIWIARQLARPFVILADSIQKLEEGNIEAPELGSHWNREADVLTRTVMTTIRNFQRQHEQLVYEANTDVLTGLTNRRMFEETIQDWVDQSHHFAILVIDIDRFKQINDSYGHQIGDVVLQEVASIIMQQVTPEDVCSRFGGEEFVVLLSNSDLHTAYLKGEQIRMAVEQAKISTERSVTVSIGIAVCPFHATVSTELFHLADSALYQAKEEGRNRTVMIQLLDVK